MGIQSSKVINSDDDQSTVTENKQTHMTQNMVCLFCYCNQSINSIAAANAGDCQKLLVNPGCTCRLTNSHANGLWRCLPSNALPWLRVLWIKTLSRLSTCLLELEYSLVVTSGKTKLFEIRPRNLFCQTQCASSSFLRCKKHLLKPRMVEWANKSFHKIKPSIPVHLGYLCLHACQLRNGESPQQIIQVRFPAGRVQAWPLPLIGAGLIQNSHQVVVDETEKKVDEYVHEDA